jgi:uncharacterized membrane protein YoaT (DUF817 family)
MVGTVMEVFKTYAGSWIYPDVQASIFHIGGVPLFSGFMYAAVGSYIARVWRIFDFRFDYQASMPHMLCLATLTYINFFTHHILPDIRLLLFAYAFCIFWRTRVYFTPHRTTYHMPLLLGFFLVALFIWLAENMGTFAAAWQYPTQRDGWHIVSLHKLGAWYLLMLISFVLVARLHAGSTSKERA